MLRQLQALVQANRTNHVERIAVLESRIVRYAVEGDNDVLIVRLSTRICDYTTDDNTGKVVSGSQTRELFMVYDWKMIRQKDMKTLDQPTMTQVSCPNCGAPLDISHSGKCPYCDTVVTLSDHDWVLSSIKGISQRSSN
jgi:transposase